MQEMTPAEMLAEIDRLRAELDKCSSSLIGDGCSVMIENEMLQKMLSQSESINRGLKQMLLKDKK